MSDLKSCKYSLRNGNVDIGGATVGRRMSYVDRQYALRVV